MRRNYRKASQIVSLGALAIVLIIGGTLAYFNQDLSASNVFLTGKYDTDLHEEFKPPGDWQPGVEIPKKVDIKKKRKCRCCGSSQDDRELCAKRGCLHNDL